MTRTHAARQLLALGPLSMPEFIAITGWRPSVCRRVLRTLCASRMARRLRRGNQHMPSAFTATEAA